MNQNIDSYIDYMENIAYLISSSEDVQDYLFDDEIDNEGRYRILNQFETILDSRSDIRNVGIISKNGRMLINDGKKSVNSDLDLNTQEWYTQRSTVRKVRCLPLHMYSISSAGSARGDHLKPWYP